MELVDSERCGNAGHHLGAVTACDQEPESRGPERSDGLPGAGAQRVRYDEPCLQTRFRSEVNNRLGAIVSDRVAA